MARPPDADSAETYERILAAAVEQVRSTVPRNKISMRRVAEQAEVSLGTLQYYFVNKDSLLEACLDGYYERLGATGAELLAHAKANQDAPVETVVTHTVRAFYGFIREEQALTELRILTNALRGELHPRRQDRFLRQIIGAAAKTLAPRVGLTEVELRLSIQTVVNTAVRMALLSDGERESLTGTSGAEALAVVEAHVIDAALRLVCPAGWSEASKKADRSVATS